jgi:hypothetical protein
MNPLFTVGTSRDPLGISAWRSVAHRIMIESSPRSFSIGSKIGYHHHQRGRPAFKLDARGRLGLWQEALRKKLECGLLCGKHPIHETLIM